LLEPKHPGAIAYDVFARWLIDYEKPRVKDFDPNAQEIPALKSSLDKMPVIQKPTVQEGAAAASPVRPVPLVPPVRVVPPPPESQLNKRHMKQRHPFDIYQDQYDSLKALALEERKQGGLGSMSAMVRDALDKYISEKRQKSSS
jgi:hypothetical protein